MKKIVKLASLLFMLQIFSCGFVDQARGLEGSWGLDGNDGYREEITFSEEGKFVWKQFQNDYLVFQREGSFEIDSTIASMPTNMTMPSGKVKQVPVNYSLSMVSLKFLKSSEQEETYTFQFVIAGEALYLIENTTTQYIRIGGEE
ncbi:MAG: hypothetical protein JXR63_03130 [Spirochaetales bacterium]|nr:hypothetical protein [Spirochaetales bacterium]